MIQFLVHRIVVEKEADFHQHLVDAHPDVVGPAGQQQASDADAVDYPCAFCKKRFLKPVQRLRHTR